MNMIKQKPTNTLRDTLIFQFDISWQMLEIHFKGLKNEECLWRPRSKGLHVWNRSGIWQADWPESEEYDIGPASMAWIIWHILFWWSMVFNYSFGDGTLTREKVSWPGDMEVVKEEIVKLSGNWRKKLAAMTEEELLSHDRTKWPFEDRPFHDLAAWLNLELMKNASEIGYCRFLFATRKE